MERSEVAACYWNLHKSCLPIALTPFPRYQFYSVYTGWPQNVVHFQHTISSEPFKIKWNKFYQNVASVLGYNKTKAKLRRILNSYVKTTTQPLFPETSGTFRWNLFYFILNGSKDIVCWKVYNFLGHPEQSYAIACDLEVSFSFDTIIRQLTWQALSALRFALRVYIG